ncbi:MAG: TRAP transporter substrate-binding protein DctP [Desulfobacter sp.]
MKNLFILLVLVLFTAVPNVTAQSKIFNLKLQSYYGTNMLNAEKEFAATVEKKSNGSIKIEVYSGGELVPSSQILNAVKTGTIELGRGMGHHFTESKIGSIESGLPMSWTSAQEAQEIYETYGLKDIIAQEYGQLGVKYLGPVWAAPYHFLGKRPITGIDAMRTMKVRAVGASAKMLKKVGVNPVNVPVEDIYLSLTTGQIDGVLYGSAFEYKETKFYEGARFFNNTPILDPIVDTLVINQAIWNAFSPGQQNVVQDAADVLRWSYYKWISGEDKKTLNELFKNTTTTFSDSDMKEMTRAALNVWNDEAAKSPRNKAAIELIKKAAKASGRL